MPSGSGVSHGIRVGVPDRRLVRRLADEFCGEPDALPPVIELHLELLRFAPGEFSRFKPPVGFDRGKGKRPDVSRSDAVQGEKRLEVGR